MKILVTGATGMLGYDLCKVLSESHDVIGLSRGRQTMHGGLLGPDLVRADITDRKGLTDIIVKHRPDVVIHSAAIADVDFCELNPDIAFKVNSEGTENVADAAKKAGSYLLYISTDYVFDGTKDSPYAEDDEPNPISVYGKSKFEAEKYIEAHSEGYFIIRSAWMFGEGGKNFVDSMLESARRNNKIRAVSDKYGSPTYTLDLSKAISDLVVKLAFRKAVPGIYHITNAGICSRYQFAREILEYLGINGEVIAIQGKDAGGAALRPKMSGLDNSKISKMLGYGLRHYRDALKDYLQYLQNKEGT